MTDFSRPVDDGLTEDERGDRLDHEAWVEAHTCPTCGLVDGQRIIAPADEDACEKCGSVDPDDAVIVARVRARQVAAMLPHAVATLDALAAKIADLWPEARRQAEGFVADRARRDQRVADEFYAQSAYALEWYRTQVGLVGNDLGSLADYLRPLTR